MTPAEVLRAAADRIDQAAFALVAPFRRRRHERLIDAEDRLLWAMRGGGRNFGYPISRAANVRPGLLYLALDRLMQKGLVEDGWEDEPTRPRRWYRLTEEGARLVAIRQSVLEGA